MSSCVTRSDTDVGVSISVVVSAVIHLAVFLLLVWWGRLFPSHVAIQETYYVDVVNLPVANPRNGRSAQKPGEADAVPPPSSVPPMTVPAPVRPAQKNGAKSVKPAAPQESAESESAFAERMARLEGKAEAQQYEEKLKRLNNKKDAGGGKAGTPNAAGTEAGSRYADFVKSRLEDALKVTSSYTTKKPEVAVRLTISAEGKLLRTKVERSSGDATFELAVRRAIDLASERFTAPPNNAVFENGFVFRPKGVTNRSSR